MATGVVGGCPAIPMQKPCHPDKALTIKGKI
jgi:hypothetical protein